VASPGLGVVGQVLLLPDGAEGGVEGRLAGLGHPQGLGEDRIAALAGGQGEVTQRARRVAQQLPRRRVGEAPVPVLDEDPLPGQQPQQPVERRRVRSDGVGQVGELTGPCGQEVGDAELGGHEDRLADHEAEDLAGELGPEFSVLIHGGQDGTGIPPRGRGATRNGSLIFGEQVLVVGREPVAEAD
jgi:hypothetical protein